MSIKPVQIKSLLLTLRQPVQLFLSVKEIPNKTLKIGNVVTSRPSFPPWPSCADVLLNTQSHTFVGVSYSVDADSRRSVRDLCQSLSGEAVRYNDLTLWPSARPYIEDDPETHRLEIVWTDVPADKVEAAQLDSGFWYYADSGQAESRVVAFGLSHISEILNDYRISLPDSFRFPFFAPDVIKYIE